MQISAKWTNLMVMIRHCTRIPTGGTQLQILCNLCHLMILNTIQLCWPKRLYRNCLDNWSATCASARFSLCQGLKPSEKWLNTKCRWGRQSVRKMCPNFSSLWKRDSSSKRNRWAWTCSKFKILLSKEACARTTWTLFWICCRIRNTGAPSKFISSSRWWCRDRARPNLSWWVCSLKINQLTLWWLKCSSKCMVNL